MNRICVNASTAYDVLVGSHLLQQAGNFISAICPPGKAAIISDSNVFPIYGNIVAESLRNSGFDVYCYTFPAGEKSKNISTYLQILDFLAQNTFTRTDMLIALGGGVAGDITGFAAATYLRGISYVQIPTSLLAMVDSSIGGKTAIDLSAGKNLVGAFYQPSLVICDTNSLDTLPDNVFSDGCAEVIKYGVLYDTSLFNELAYGGPMFDRMKVISRCIELKRNVVCEDEFDRGARQLLNFGHTFGHAIELQSNFTISHGQAVAIGMAIAAKAGWKNGFCSQDVYTAICNILKIFHLPAETDFTAAQLAHSALNDKKRAGNSVNLIIPKTIGECIITPIATEELQSFIQAGL